MSWQRFRVELKGEDPIEVQTNARDWAAVRVDGSASNPIDMTFQVVHKALMRTGHEVPRNYDAFLEVLEGMPENLEEDSELLDPTQPDR